MAAAIPKEPRTISLNSIEKILFNRRIYCSRRSLQRDVLALEEAFSGFLLVRNGNDLYDDDRSTRLSWSKDADYNFLFLGEDRQ